ncbi:MAG: transposase [Lachnospiraceae bacterium]|nr:transposase [Lachnospiraceae bacterium]
MTPDSICKIVCQYNRFPVPKEDMDRLLEIAENCRQVKDYVYQRYGSIRNLSKLYPGYTVQNEMTRNGLRENLGLPSVYFYLAVFDALRDLKSQWTRTKSAVSQKIHHHQEFSEEEKHYLRYILKVSNAFEAVLNCKKICLKPELQRQYELLAKAVDRKRLDQYLRRQVRRVHRRINAGIADGFSLSERAYRYGDRGIYITMKEKRKRIFIPLTDNNQYTRQIYIKLYPEEKKIELKVPVSVRTRRHSDYKKQVGTAMGIYTMLVTDQGHSYGEKLGDYQIELADWIREQTIRYHPQNEAESGRKKYTAQKQCKTEQLHSYINMELNRFLRTEKPEVIYFPKLPKPQKHSGDKEINHSVNLWQRGYIRKRLQQKCQEQSVELIEVFGKNISKECSRCGAFGKKREKTFVCETCGYKTEAQRNTAQNAKKRGMDHKNSHLDE